MESVSNDGSFDRPLRLCSVVSKLIRRRGLVERSSNTGLESAWKKAVGEELAARSSARRLNAGILEVIVTNSAALEQLRGFLHGDVLDALQRQLPDSGIRGIRYVRKR
jgi:Dna[CI] antecedent, DciA